MNMLRKYCLVPIALIVGFGSAIQAQERTYIISPANTVIETASADEEFVKYYIYQENKTSSDLVLAWRRLHADIPAGWDYSLCDLGACYPGIPDSNTMAAAPPGEKAFLAMNIYPYGVVGTANIRMAVWDVNNPSIVDTVSWSITITPSASIEAPLGHLLPLSIYPNPSSDRLFVQLAEHLAGTLQIINSLGAEVLSVKSAGSSVALDISHLPTGAYRLLFTSGDGGVSRAAFIKR